MSDQYYLRSNRVLKENIHDDKQKHEKVEEKPKNRVAFRNVNSGDHIDELVVMKPTIRTEDKILLEKTPSLKVQVLEQTSPGVDKNDLSDTQAVVEYAKAIFEHFRIHEKKYLPSPYLMDSQSELKEVHRVTLFDWLVDIHMKFKMLPETYFLTINLVDRFLETSSVSKNKFQLVGISAMMIAGKYEEIYPPKLPQYCKVCAGAYTEEEIKSMEQLILDKLNWNLTVATAETFLARYLKISSADTKISLMSNFFVEVASMDLESYQHSPSIVASAAIMLSKSLLNHTDVWDYACEYYTSYKKADLEECMLWLVEKVDDIDMDENCTALKRKYDSKKYNTTWTSIQGLVCLFKSTQNL
jgi:hypothetical protein